MKGMRIPSVQHYVNIESGDGILLPNSRLQMLHVVC